jgi:hydroxymethylbilane synthase
MGKKPIRLATRGSPLAMTQTELVMAALRGAGIPAEPVVVETSGDRLKDVPIHAIGGQGVFVKEVDAAVLDGSADASVHSAKDLPSSPPPPSGASDSVTAGGGSRATDPAGGIPPGELPIAAVLPRGDPRDALVGVPLEAMRAGARVATGSVRRRAQLAWLRPDLCFAELRGNVTTRLEKVPAGGAVVVAMAALVRLGLKGRAAQVLSTREMLPQVGQGAVAVCCRPEDSEMLSLLGTIDDRGARVTLSAERAWLAATGGGCDLPVGAHATLDAGGTIALEAMIASLDGHVLVRQGQSGDDAEVLGTALARSMLSAGGGRALLEQEALAR